MLSPYEYLKVSGGIFFDMMIHDFDMIRFLSGSEIYEVYATGGVFTDCRLKDIPDVDTAIAVLKLENGMIAVVDAGRQCFYGHDQRSEVYCSEGTVQTVNVTENTVVVSNAEGIHTPKPVNFFIERYMEAYIEQDKKFVDSVLNGTPITVGIEDGVKPILIAKAAQLSFEQNRPVEISEIEF
jgi:myo-inositol 2-dehydrogenase/D-chiro-inositol 1-dehydrogenase